MFCNVWWWWWCALSCVEYIVYDVSQIRMRYLVRLRFKYQ